MPSVLPIIIAGMPVSCAYQVLYIVSDPARLVDDHAYGAGNLCVIDLGAEQAGAALNQRNRTGQRARGQRRASQAIVAQSGDIDQLPGYRRSDMRPVAEQGVNALQVGRRAGTGNMYRLEHLVRVGGGADSDGGRRRARGVNGTKGNRLHANPVAVARGCHHYQAICTARFHCLRPHIALAAAGLADRTNPEGRTARDRLR